VGEQVVGRGSIMLGTIDHDGDEPVPPARWDILIGSAGYDEAVPRLFAWADVAIHEHNYDDAAYDQYEAECVRYEDDGRYYGETFEEWQETRTAREGLHPYREDGEIAYWRLELTLNELGRAFLLIDQSATDGDPQLTVQNVVNPTDNH
jgi:hypothetical protein